MKIESKMLLTTVGILLATFLLCESVLGVSARFLRTERKGTRLVIGVKAALGETIKDFHISAGALPNDPEDKDQPQVTVEDTDNRNWHATVTGGNIGIHTEKKDKKSGEKLRANHETFFRITLPKGYHWSGEHDQSITFTTKGQAARPPREEDGWFQDIDDFVQPIVPCSWCPKVPTLTQWGLIILAMLLLTGATFILCKRRKTAVA